MIAIPASAAHDFRSARKYLARDPIERNIFHRLEMSKTRFHLWINHRNNDSFDPNTDTIAWDPGSALRTTGGGRQSPALGLGHEADHAAEDPKINQHLSSIPDRHYDNKEERRVITGSERHAARILGESIRHDHGGTTYRVDAPTDR
ncbi:MAG: hypothetical protein ABI182_02340 [Candidatus Baltobacteraceae bacterium]